MIRHDDEWLKQKIEEDLIAMADEREQELMASESYQYIDMSEEKMKELRALIIKERELREEEKLRQKTKKKSFSFHGGLRLRPAMIAAVVIVLCLGTGLVSTGSRVYIPEILRGENGDGEQIKVENSDSVYSEYDEEQVCLEIEEKIGVIPIRLGYRPFGICLTKYNIWEESTEVLMEYEYDKKNLFIYISKDLNNSSISNQVDGEKQDTIKIASIGIEIPVHEYADSNGERYYETSFKYLNTYYSINGMIDLEQFINVLENIIIKNA